MKNKYLEYQVGVDDSGDNCNHYTEMKIEPMEFMLSNMSTEELYGVLKFNVTKYIWRDKRDKKEDINKAKHYIELITEELNNRESDTYDYFPDRQREGK